MKEIALKANKREAGKQIAKRLRRNGSVPGIYYMDGTQPVPISTDPLSLRPIVYTASKKIVNLNIEGDSTPKSCVLKEVKFHPVTDKIIHFDLLGLNPDRKLVVQVPVVIKGQAAGVRKGGKIQQYIHNVKVKCLPKDLIDQIEVDVTTLQMGQSIYLGDVPVENVEFDKPNDTIIVAVFAPRGASQAELEGESAE